MSTAGLNSEFSFSYKGCLTTAKVYNLPHYSPIAEGRTVGIMLFPRHKVKRKEPRSRFRIRSPTPFPLTITITLFFFFFFLNFGFGFGRCILFDTIFATCKEKRDQNEGPFFIEEYFTYEESRGITCRNVMRTVLFYEEFFEYKNFQIKSKIGSYMIRYRGFYKLWISFLWVKQ